MGSTIAKDFLLQKSKRLFMLEKIFRYAQEIVIHFVVNDKSCF